MVSFCRDNPSVTAFRAKKFDVALGFKKVTFKIKIEPMGVSLNSTTTELTQEPQPSTSRGSEMQDRPAACRSWENNRVTESLPRSSGGFT